MAFSKFTQVDFNDGASPPINADTLDELERVVKETDTELGRTNDIDFSELTQYFYERNSQVALFFNDYTAWTEAYPSQTTLSDEDSNNLMGNSCLKILNDLATAGWMSITAAPSKDLTQFNDGSASTTDDLIAIHYYCSDSAAFSDLEFKFGDDFSNCYFYDYGGSVQTGWHVIWVPKSSFVTTGSPTGWNSITYVRIAPYVDAGYSGEYMYFQRVFLVRQDPAYSGYCNFFQKYYGSSTGWLNVFSIPSDFCALYHDEYNLLNKLGYMHLDGEYILDQLTIYTDVIEFISKFEFYCKYAGESPSIVWMVDSNNYIEVYISSDTFYMYAYESAAGTTTSKALDVGLEKNERFYIYFEKEIDTCRAILKKDGESIKILEYETSIASDSEGYVYLGQHTANSYCLLTDFKIGNKKINYLRDENLPRYIRKEIQQTFSNNTLANVSRMYAYLAPFQYYKIELHLVCSCADASPDVKIAWSVTDLQVIYSRVGMGPETGSTSALDTNVRISCYNYTSSIPYGLDGSSSETYINETLIVYSGADAGKIQLQGAQNNTDGSHPTTIYGRSYMIITPVNAQATIS